MIGTLHSFWSFEAGTFVHFLTICRLTSNIIYWPFFFKTHSMEDPSHWFRILMVQLQWTQHPSIFQLKEWNWKVIICKLSILTNQRFIFNFWLNDDHLYIEPLSSIAMLNQGFNAIHMSVTLQEQSAFSSKGMLSVNQFLVGGFKYFLFSPLLGDELKPPTRFGFIAFILLSWPHQSIHTTSRWSCVFCFISPPPSSPPKKASPNSSHPVFDSKSWTSYICFSLSN